MKIPFTKMHGAGNDYVYVNGFEVTIADPAAAAIAVSPRRKAVGSDGLIILQPSEIAAVRMEMYNADGSRGEMCGNGIRCVGKLAFERGLTRDNPMSVETDVGVKTLELDVRAGRVASVNVDMGEPILEPSRIPARFDGACAVDVPLEVAGRTHRVTCVSMGNPHCVLFLDGEACLDDLALETIGPPFERHERFPKRVNTEFLDVVGRGEMRMRVWERGSGETAACGTGACAAAVAGVLTGRTDRSLLIHLVGGDLSIEWREQDGRVYMRGEAVEVFRGEIEI